MIWILAVTFLMSLLPSCSDDSLTPAEPTPSPSSPDVWLTLHLDPTGITSTRADESAVTDTQGHPEEAGTAAENFISSKKMTIAFLNKNYVAFKVIKSDSPEFFSFDSEKSNNNSWTAIIKINSQLMNLINGDSHFYILVVANTTGTNGVSDEFKITPWKEHGGYVIGDDRWGYTITHDPWIPKGTDDSCIPMGGMIKVNIPSSWEEYNTIENPFFTKSIPMMRSMMKVRILDGIKNDIEFKDYYYIKNVSIKGVERKGTFIPTNDGPRNDGHSHSEYALNEWKDIVNGDNNGILEEASSMWRDNEWILKMTETELQSIDLSSGNPVKIDDLEYECFNAYLPEIKTKADCVVPYLTITTSHIIYKTNSQGQIVVDDNGNKVVKSEIETVWPDIKISDYLMDTNGNRLQMVRNHIYQFVVTMTPQNNLKLNYQICDWQIKSTSITFD